MSSWTKADSAAGADGGGQAARTDRCHPEKASSGNP